MIDVRICASFPFGRFGYITLPNGDRRFVLNYMNTGVHHPNATPPQFCCPPDGDYDLEPHNTPKHPDTWAWVNHSLGVYHEPVPGMPVDSWTAVLFHPANKASQLAACFAPGVELDLFSGILGVGSSEVAFLWLKNYIKSTNDLKVRLRTDASTPWPVTS